MTGAFWPLLAMVEVIALLAAVVLCVVLGIAGLAVQLRRRHAAEPHATRAVTTAPVASAPQVEQDDDPDPFPF